MFNVVFKLWIISYVHELMVSVIRPHHAWEVHAIAGVPLSNTHYRTIGQTMDDEVCSEKRDSEWHSCIANVGIPAHIYSRQLLTRHCSVFVVCDLSIGHLIVMCSLSRGTPSSHC